jgi:hypothetical protein
MTGRESLVEASLRELFVAFDQACAEGIRQPVVFLIDCQDEIGEQVVRAWEGDDAVDAAILAVAESRPDNEDGVMTPTLTRAFAMKECVAEVPQLFPYLAGTFSEPYPEDGFLVVAISFGGAATFVVPCNARPDAGR